MGYVWLQYCMENISYYMFGRWDMVACYTQSSNKNDFQFKGPPPACQQKVEQLQLNFEWPWSWDILNLVYALDLINILDK